MCWKIISEVGGLFLRGHRSAILLSGDWKYRTLPPNGLIFILDLPIIAICASVH
jgi:hypothetical protein